MLNLGGSNYHYGKCSVENWLVKELFREFIWGYIEPSHFLGISYFVCSCFLFLCHNITEPKSSEVHSLKPINVNNGNKKGGMHQCKCRITYITLFFPCKNCTVIWQREYFLFYPFMSSQHFFHFQFQFGIFVSWWQ